MSLPLASNFDENDLLFPKSSQIAVSPPLAVKLGLSTATILGYFHEVLQEPTYVIDDIPWIEVTHQDISDALLNSFSSATIRRHIKKLEGLGLMKSCRLSTHKWRQTKSYTICYDAVQTMLQE